MWLLAGLAKWNIVAKLALPGVYVWQTALLTAFYLRHCYNAVCGFQRLGRTVGQGRRARGILGHGPAAAVAAAYPLRRRTDTVITGARLAPDWLHGRGHLVFLLATPFDAARLYWGFGMHAPRPFTLSHAGESCCQLVWGRVFCTTSQYPCACARWRRRRVLSWRPGCTAPKVARAVEAL
jgi:hypothetical protein